MFDMVLYQLTYTYSNSTIKSLEDVDDVVLVFLLLTLNIFHAFFSVSIINVEQENINWDC